MKVFRELVEIKNSCLGLGFFDGVHLGHEKLIKELIKQSKALKSSSVIITFKKSPAENFLNDVKYLTTSKEKLEILSDIGVDNVVELDFNDKLMGLTAQEYLNGVLIKHFSPKLIISGFNHTFGKNKQGNAQFLKDNQTKYAYRYEEISPVKIDNEIISSTLIKNLLNNGNIKKANTLLGHSYTISGEVVHGNQIGMTLGYPTANIIYPKNKAKIPLGVYSTLITTEGKIYRGMMNYGIKPTINKDCKPVAEVHIIGFNKNIYGKEITISVIEKIRDEIKFNSVDELKQQIKRDINKC